MTTRTLTIAPRFLDADEEPLGGESVVEGFGEEPVVSIEEAIAEIETADDNYEDMVEIAKSKACYTGDDLTKDEAAAIYLYTMKHFHPNQDISTQLNKALRSGIQMDLSCWIPYLQLLVNGLNKLPQKQGKIWRCVNDDIANNYRSDCMWLGFSSCTETQWVAEDFVDKYKPHTLFVIDCVSGKAIRNYSDHAWEDEVLLMPGTHLRVMKKESRPNGIKVVHLKEEPSYVHPFTWPITYTAPIERNYLLEPELFLMQQEPESVSISQDLESISMTQEPESISMAQEPESVSTVQEPESISITQEPELISVPPKQTDENLLLIFQDNQEPLPKKNHAEQQFKVKASEEVAPCPAPVYTSFVEVPCNRGKSEKTEHYQEKVLDSKDWLNYYYYKNSRRAAMSIIDLEGRLEDPPRSVDPDVLERVRGSLFGMVVGDALGISMNSQTQQRDNIFKQEDIESLGKGQFTNDVSMSLCLAASLIVRGDFVPYDQLVRYKWWFRSGYMASTGNSFNVDRAIYESLVEFERRQELFSYTHKISSAELDKLAESNLLSKFDIKCGKTGGLGRAPLGRLASVPLFFYKYPVDAVEFSGISGVITHGSSKVYDACRYFGALMVAALRGESKTDILDDYFYERHQAWFNNKPLCSEVLNISRGSYKIKGNSRDGSAKSQTIFGVLESVLQAFYYDQDSFEKGIVSIVENTDDIDGISTIYGQLAGAHYGFKKIPQRWTRQTFARNTILCFCKWIVHEGERWKPGFSSRSYAHTLVVPTEPSTPKQRHYHASRPMPMEQQSKPSFQPYSRTAHNVQEVHKEVLPAWQPPPERHQTSTIMSAYDRQIESSGNARPNYNHGKPRTNDQDTANLSRRIDALLKDFRDIRVTISELDRDGNWKLPVYNQQERYEELRSGVFYKLPNYVHRFPSDPQLHPEPTNNRFRKH